MNASNHLAAHAAPRRRRAFALVITLLILSLLIIVVVSYLSSMVNERQTADAYAAKARAEQAAQAAVDSATAILTESFRDFPDSATVWDTQQSQNTGTPSNRAIVNTPNNEGTSLYLRAISTTASVPAATVADPQATSTAAANDLKGNNPNNPACMNFVLPLISGVPGGRARLVSEKLSTSPGKPGMVPLMDLSVSDPVTQNFTDLNVCRFAGDLQGVIGSPPGWATTTPTPVGPKPARALWVNLKDSAGRLTGRYAFWMEDESFRTNINYANFDNANASTNPSAPLRADNSADGKSVVDPTTSKPRSVLPKDTFLSGALAGFPLVFDASSNTQSVLDTRNVYPGHFLPDPLAFTHEVNNPAGTTTLSTPVIDGLRYLTTTQSSALNLSRHGTQRLDLNATTTIDAGSPVKMAEIRKLVETIRFHLPNFGQRFYRTSNPDTVAASGKAALLNNPTAVTTGSTGNAEIYLYKTAANLRDYIDTDDQPTMIVHPVSPATVPTLWDPKTPVLFPFGGDGKGGNGPNYMWAQGKDGAPFIQEAMVRYRPSIPHDSDYGSHYTLAVDYYVEVWNMSDHDVTAASLNHPFLRISNQQPWAAAYIPATGGSPTTGALPQIQSELLGLSSSDVDTMGRDFNLDLVTGVFRGDSPTTPAPSGVVFKAGQATVITTDPDFVSTGSNTPVIQSVNPYGGLKLGSSGLVAANTYYCSNATPARKVYAGATSLAYKPGYLRGILPNKWDVTTSTVYLNFEVETTLANDFGYLDCATGAFCLSAGKTDAGSNGWDFTWKDKGDVHNDYIHGGTLGGNTNTPSELGDPRTNNEQLYIQLYNGTSFPAQPDQYRYGSPASNLNPPCSLGSPNSKYVLPASGAYPWSDYFDWPAASGAYPIANLDAASTPGVIANSPLTSIGQLGDIFDPARTIGTVGSASILNSRGGGRTLKIGQRDDRVSYDASGNSGNNSIDNVPASTGWASWRLADVFCIGDSLELPGRININGVARDGGAALRAALTGFRFQPVTQTGSDGQVVDPLIHGTNTLSGATLETSTTGATGVSKLVNQIIARLAAPPTYKANGGNTPYGPFFERGEFGELENGGNTNGSSALFGRNISGTAVSTWPTSTDLTGKDLNRTFDRGREELFRRMAELICTRGDTFTVYVVGQSMNQTDASKPAKIAGTHRMRVTFRLVPKIKDPATQKEKDFHRGNNEDSTGLVTGGAPDFDPDDLDATHPKSVLYRFAKPDFYDVQVLEVNTL